MAEPLPEVWLRGPLTDMPPLLQPAAHALLQAKEEVKSLMMTFPEALLWQRPAGVASVGFHLLHMAGVLHRLCTYAKGEALTDEQLAYLKSEEKPGTQSALELVQQLEQQVQNTLEQLKHTKEDTLTQHRAVGRKGLPSTVQGLLFHAAEHTMRHLGQLFVTVKVVQAMPSV